MGVLYVPYLAQWGIVSLRESENVCKKNDNLMVVQELLIVVLLLRAVSLPLGIRQGLDQDGSAHCLPRGTRVWWSPVARSLCPQEVLLLPLQKTKAPSPQSSQKEEFPQLPIDRMGKARGLEFQAPFIQ